ncbi:MAG TPA: PAS domain S-box protein [Bacteroidia bacterium]|nr:PAS domain S-box protein [Bacteroidia bacterium]
MATGKGFIEVIKDRKQVALYELYYYRLICVLFALTYILTYNLDFLNTSSSVEFLFRRDFFAILPLTLLILSFALPIVKQKMAAFMSVFFTIVTLHMIGYFYINDFRTHYEIIILTLIFFSNLHFNQIIYLVLYNVIVLAALEGIYLIGDAASKTNPVYAFILVLSVMLICIAYQIYRIRFREAISERENMLSSINNQMPDAWIIFNRDTLRAIEANQKAVELLGMNQDKSIEQFTLEQLIEFKNNDLFAVVAEADNGTFVERESEIRTNSSEPYYALLTLKTIKGKPDLVYAKFNNINAFKQKQIIQENKQERYIRMLENVSEGIIVIGENGDLVFINKRVADILGESKQELIIGRRLFDLLGDDLMLNKQMSIELNNGTRIDLREKRLTTNNNKSLWVRLTGSSVSDDSGKVNDIIWVLTDITAYIRKEELSTENEESFRKIFEESELGMVQLTSKNRVLRVNAAFVSLLEFTKDDLQKFELSDLLHPDEVVQFNGKIESLERGIIPYAKFESRFITKSGQTVWTSSTMSAIKNRSGELLYVMLMVDDITKSKLMAKALSESQSNLSALVENTSDAIIGFDLSYEINVINSVSKNYFNKFYGAQLNMNDNLKEAFDSLESNQWISTIDQVMRKGQASTIEESFTIENIVYHFETTFHPVLNEMNQTCGVSCFSSDVTQRVVNEIELRKAREIAEQATGEKSRFLATMSHEIRTPLNGLIGMSQLLRNTPLTKDQNEYVDSIQLSGEALLNIINDVLDYSKIESGMMQLELLPFSVRKIIEQSINIIGYKAEEKDLSLSYSIDENVPAGIVGDSNRLRQILMNLLSNSIKFTREGKISIAVRVADQDDDSMELEFCVSDTGIGINKEKQEKLFKEFSQADVSTSREYGGSGLGLSICSRLVKLMDGKIWVKSEEGIGSDFCFTIRAKTGEVQPEIIDIPSASNQVFVFGNVVPSYLQNSVSGQQKVHLIKDFESWNSVGFDNLTNAWFIIQATYKPSLIKSFIENIRGQLDNSIKVFVFGAPSNDPDDYIYGSLVDSFIDENYSFDSIVSESSTRVKILDSNGKKDISFAQQNPLSILVAEDNSINQKLVEIILKQLGYTIKMVEDGQMACNQMQDQNYDLVFMDVQMPVMNGIEATKLIREMKLKQQPVIIAMTAFALEGDKQICLDAGMNDYISKPIDIGDIQKAIVKHFKHKANLTEKPKKMNDNTEAKLLNEIALNRLIDINAKVDSEFLSQVVNMYAEQAPELIHEIEVSLRTNELDKIWKAAHKLKGSSLNMGAEQVSNICRKIETDAKQGISKDLKTNLESLKKYYEITMLELSKLVSTNQQRNIDK